MKRKEFLQKGLIGTLAAGSIAGCIPAPDAKGIQMKSDAPYVHSGKKYRWKMVTTWPPKFPVLGESAELFAEFVNKMSAGRIEIKVYGGGELVPALEVFDNVSAGTAEMGCGASYYWAGKSAAAQYFCAVPFGMNAQQMAAWLLSGGGYELWKEVYAKFNLVPLFGGNTGVQMGGWFNKEINAPEDLKGLKMRMPGLGGKVLEKAGGAAVLVAGSEVYTTLERGVIDAAEWIGPYHDYKMGFHKIAKYYYTPGWHETGSELEFTINKSVYDALPEDLKAILYAAGLQIRQWVLAEFDAKNLEYLNKIKAESDVEIRLYPDEVLTQLKQHTRDALSELSSKDPITKKVHDHYFNFLNQVKEWSALSEKAFYNKIQA